LRPIRVLSDDPFSRNWYKTGQNYTKTYIYIDGDTCQLYCTGIGGSSGHVIQTYQLYY